MSESKEAVTKSAQSLTKGDQLKALYTECGLVKEDVHKHRHYIIITRTGIEKIQYAKGIDVRFEVIQCEVGFAAVKAVGTMKVGEVTERIETYGSAYQGNCTNNYYLEMAEKRALSRIVLKMTKAYSLGVFGEDEADDFKKNKTA
jgi:hypothetical protein